METLVSIVHVLAALGVIGLVLLQHGKGADMGAAFGSGASGSLFGVSGSSNFMSRATAVFVAIFFATSLTLAYMSSHRTQGSSVVKLPTNSVVAPGKANESAPAKPAESSPAKDVPQ
ncbi:MAG TPA: preprotein translocase subunit SecG [Methylovorus sp.]|jgi:preprotein translocase subunit SecG|nr:preprotein translocase subunit SecG [Methylovorus sp.]